MVFETRNRKNLKELSHNFRSKILIDKPIRCTRVDLLASVGSGNYRRTPGLKRKPGGGRKVIEDDLEAKLIAKFKKEGWD